MLKVVWVASMRSDAVPASVAHYSKTADVDLRERHNHASSVCFAVGFRVFPITAALMDGLDGTNLLTSRFEARRRRQRAGRGGAGFRSLRSVRPRWGRGR